MEDKSLKQLEAFGFKKSSDRTHRTFAEALRMMLDSQRRCIKYYTTSLESDDDIISSGLLDGSIKAFEDYTETFRDIYTMYTILIGDRLPGTLLECIRMYKGLHLCSDDGNRMLDFLYARNKLVHQYYNREYLLEQFQTALDNYSEGLLDIYEKLYGLIAEADYLEEEIR